jgi:hypothetical protein
MGVVTRFLPCRGGLGRSVLVGEIRPLSDLRLIGRRLSLVAARALPYGQEDEALLVGQGLSRLLALPPARFEHPHGPADGKHLTSPDRVERPLGLGLPGSQKP